MQNQVNIADFSFLFYANPQPMWIFDVETLKILEVNDAAVNIYGYSRAEFLNKTIADIRPEEDREDTRRIVAAIQGHNTNFREYRHINKAGQILHVEIVSYSLTYNGRNARMVYVHNVDQLKVINIKLEELENSLEQILETTNIGFFRTNNHFVVSYWNKAAETLIGYKRDYVIGKNLWEVFPEAIHSDFYTFFQKALTEQMTVEFVEYFWPLQKWFSAFAHPTDGGLIVHFDDVTEKTRTVQSLQDKLRQLNEISYLNSHYIRKPIASLLGLANLVREENLEERELKEAVEHIYTCSIELDEIVRKVNNKVHAEDMLQPIFFEMNDFSLRELLEEIAGEARRKYIKHRVDIVQQDELVYYGNREGIKTALKIMIDNAVSYSPRGEMVLIRADVIYNNLVISVRDFGVGLDQEHLNKIFISFTKGTLKTSLSKVIDIVNRHNGNIWVESKPGKGALFSARFPLSKLAYASGKSNFSVYESPGLQIDFNETGHYLYADWKGFHNLQTVRAGCLKLLDAIVQYKTVKLLNNNTNVMGSWESASEWVGKEWGPLANKAGLSHIAWIYSKSTFSQLATDRAIASWQGNITIRTFGDIDEAATWLNNAQ